MTRRRAIEEATSRPNVGAMSIERRDLVCMALWESRSGISIGIAIGISIGIALWRALLQRSAFLPLVP